MSLLPGLLNLFSCLLLAVVVASVYTVSQHPDLSMTLTVRQTLRRILKLVVVLAALAATVYFLSMVG
ncbi:hypothetical protein CVU37_01845 [candidate division BRC1 bacterium HGW-BRC1-1]|jgi:hypothetical protein|nr:MAG: hypothetical protein CVU37_01845 [candidate division BRC1 bacterium HGW-BRC1-1]